MISTYYVLGTMSGTSLDGLDVAFCRFSKTTSGWDYQVIAATTFPYEDELRTRLSEATHLSAIEFVKLDIDLSLFMAQSIQQFLLKQPITPDFIASHGHTIFHQPDVGMTSQIGRGAVLAARTGLTTVCDFRTVDVALGGQGAPLVPIGDALLFGQYDACLNLGGFSNISFRRDGRRVAFDIAPCNMALNYIANKRNMPYDNNGDTARVGNIDDTLLNKLNSLDYYRLKGAKSLGKEWFESTFLPLLNASKASIINQLRTLTEHIAMQIAASSHGKDGEKMLVTGGGAHNQFLIERLNSLGNKEIIIPDTKTIDFKEAIIFAFLGVLRMNGEVNCLREVTGARINNCGGAVYKGTGIS